MFIEKLKTHETNHEVWYDRGIGAGEWKPQLQERLDWCEGLIYLLTQMSVKSDYCQWECVTAMAYKKEILPVLAQGNTKSPAYLGEYQHFHLDKGTDEIEKLLKALVELEQKMIQISQSK